MSAIMENLNKQIEDLSTEEVALIINFVDYIKYNKSKKNVEILNSINKMFEGDTKYKNEDELFEEMREERLKA